MEKRKKKRRISSFNGYLSHSSSRVEFELGLGLRLTKKLNDLSMNYSNIPGHMVKHGDMLFQTQ